MTRAVSRTRLSFRLVYSVTIIVRIRSAAPGTTRRPTATAAVYPVRYTLLGSDVKTVHRDNIEISLLHPQSAIWGRWRRRYPRGRAPRHKIPYPTRSLRIRLCGASLHLSRAFERALARALVRGASTRCPMPREQRAKRQEPGNGPALIWGLLLALVTAFGFPQQLALEGLCTAQRERVRRAPCEERSSDFKRARATHMAISAHRIALVSNLDWLSTCGAYRHLASGAYRHQHGSLVGSCGGGCGGVDVERHSFCDPTAQPVQGSVTFAPVPGR